MGCKDLLNIHDAVRIDGGGGRGDAPRGIDSAPGCYGTGLEQVCLAAMPTNPRTLMTSITDADCMPYESSTVPVCLIAAGTITINTTAIVRADTTLPLVVLANTAIDISGKLDAASHLSPASTGPGVALPGCA